MDKIQNPPEARRSVLTSFGSRFVHQSNEFSCFDQIVNRQFHLTQVLKRVSRFQEEFRVVFLDEGGAGAQHNVRGTGEDEHNILISILQRSLARNRLLIESCERHILFQKYFSMFLKFIEPFFT